MFLGILDPPLSVAGCDHVARSLSGIAVAVSYVSPLLRAKQTARHLCSALTIEVPDLREIDYGEWSGKTWSDIERECPELAARKAADWLGVTPPGAESWSELLDRVGAVLKMIRAGERPAAVIAHQGVNAALAQLIDGRSPLEFNQQYGEVIRVEVD